MTKSKKMNDSIKSFVVLVSICLVVAVLMAAINAVTAPKIEKANAEAERAALQEVLAGATEFEEIEGGELPESVKVLRRDKGGAGYAAILEAKGYDSAKPIKIAVGFDPAGKILAVKVVSCTGETSGIGTKVTEESFLSQFVGKDHTLSGVDTISGATISSSAFREAVHDASEYLQGVIAKEVAQ